MTADGLVVPGVGAAACMAGLRKISGERITRKRVRRPPGAGGSVSHADFVCLRSNSVQTPGCGTGRGRSFDLRPR